MAPLANKMVNSPFPLSVLTCVAVESTSHIFLRCESGTDDGRILFFNFLLLMDPKFKPPMKKGFLKSMRQRWPSLDFSDCNTAPDIIYKSFRNTLTHAYRSYGVYITEDETNSWAYGDGFIRLNPYWFWRVFHSAYSDLFTKVHSAADGDVRCACCLKYLTQLLS